MPDLQGDSVRKEPVGIIDTTGSMNEEVYPGAGVTKRQLATSVFQTLVADLAGADTQGRDESKKGGLLTLWYADGLAGEVGGPAETPEDVMNESDDDDADGDTGDLNPDNFETRWAKLHWRGGTYIMPAFDLMMAKYKKEYGHLPEPVQPELLVGVLNDGALYDLQRATNFLRSAKGKLHVYVVVVGSGPEHDKAIASWLSVAESNPHVKVESADRSTDAHAIAQRILAMVQ